MALFYEVKMVLLTFLSNLHHGVLKSFIQNLKFFIADNLYLDRVISTLNWVTLLWNFFHTCKIFNKNPPGNRCFEFLLISQMTADLSRFISRVFCPEATCLLTSPHYSNILRRFLPVLKEIVFLKPFRVVNLTFFEDLENWFIGVVDSWALAKYLGVQLKEIFTMNPPDQNGGHVNNLDGDKKEKRVYKVVLTGGLLQYYADITV